MKQLVIENRLPIYVFLRIGHIEENSNLTMCASLHFHEPQTTNRSMIKKIGSNQHLTINLPNGTSGVELDMQEIMNSVNYEGGEDENTIFVRLASLKSGQN